MTRLFLTATEVDEHYINQELAHFLKGRVVF